VSCSYQASGVEAACADYSVSGDTRGQDVTTVENNACTAGGGTIVGSCSTANTLGTCTITDSAAGVTVSAVEQGDAGSGATAAQAEMVCAAENGVNGVTATWSAH